MKLILTLLLSTVCALTSLFAQPVYEWTQQYGSANDVYGRGVAMDQNGDLVSIGSFNDTLTIDMQGTPMVFPSNGNADSYVHKFDSDGNMIWAVSFGDAFNDVARDMTIDASGDVYVIGNYKGIVDFDPGAGVYNLSSTGQTEAFIMKLTGAGDFAWAHTLGGITYERSFGVITDGNNDVYISGYYGDTVDFDPGPGVAQHVANGPLDAFVVKFDSDGNYLNSNTFGSDSEDIALALATDNSNNLYIAGYYSDTIDLDPGPGAFGSISQGDADLFLEKLDVNGNFLWAITIGDTLDQSARYVVTDQAGDVYYTGTFEGIVDFDPSTGTDIRTSAGGVDGYIQKVSSSGQYMWTRTFGGTYDDRGRSISLDTLGNIYLAGDFADTVDFNNGGSPQVLVAGDTIADLFVLSLDTDGNFNWVESVGGTGLDAAFSIANNNAGDLYLTGIFQVEVDFDISGGTDLFQSVDSTLDAYLFKWSQTCVANLDTSVTTDGWNLLTANQVGATYQWLDCDDNYSEIVGATDQEFYPSNVGNFAVAVTLNGCTDTSSCHYIMLWGLDELSNDHLSIAPNPTQQHVTIRSSSMITNGNITVFNLEGRSVYSESIENSDAIELELTGAPGIYFVEVTSNEGWVARQRVIKQ